MKKELLLCLPLFALGACVRTMPMQVAPSNMPLSGPGSAYRAVGQAEGRSCETHLFGAFLIGEPSRLQLAIDDALARSGGSLLVGVTTDVSFTNYILFTKTCALVRGIAVKGSRDEAYVPQRESPAEAAGFGDAAAAVSAPAPVMSQEEAIQVYFSHLRRGDRVEVSFKGPQYGSRRKQDGRYVFLSLDRSCALLQPAWAEHMPSVRCCPKEVESIQKY